MRRGVKRGKKPLTKAQRRDAARRQTASILGGHCAVCGKKFGKWFVVHHVRYEGPHDTYRDYPARSPEYAQYILDEVCRRPSDFALLCRDHHRMVEMLKGMDIARFEAMVDIVTRSRPPEDQPAGERQTLHLPGTRRVYAHGRLFELTLGENGEQSVCVLSDENLPRQPTTS